MEVEENKKIDLLDVICIFFCWKKVIIGVCLVVGLGSVIIVLFLLEYYQLIIVFFVISLDQVILELFFGDGMIVLELYGNENDIDCLLIISESNELIDFLVDFFNFYMYYDIDQDSFKG